MLGTQERLKEEGLFKAKEEEEGEEEEEEEGLFKANAANWEVDAGGGRREVEDEVVEDWCGTSGKEYQY